jgi:hypothetical protein
MRTAILLFALAIVAPPAMLGGLKQPWKPPTPGIASTWWWSPEPMDLNDPNKDDPLANYRHSGSLGCWPEYTAWYNKHHCYSAEGGTKCRD